MSAKSVEIIPASGTLGSRCRAAMAAASIRVSERSDAALRYLRSSRGFSPIWWVGAKLWAAVCAFGRLVQWILVPNGDAPLDVLKHYVSVLIVLMRFLMRQSRCRQTRTK